MSQITHGLYKVFSIPKIYSLFQNIVFPKRKFVNKYLAHCKDLNVLDIGCGTADVLKYMPSCHYVGIDGSLAYINQAKKCFSDIGTFYHVDVNNINLQQADFFDFVISIGVLHHLDDNEVMKLFDIAKQSLTINGNLMTVDPCYVPNQSLLSKWVMAKDRGKNVREVQHYIALAKQVFSRVEYKITYDLLIFPYPEIIMYCYK